MSEWFKAGLIVLIAIAVFYLSVYSLTGKNPFYFDYDKSSNGYTCLDHLKNGVNKKIEHCTPQSLTYDK